MKPSVITLTKERIQSFWRNRAEKDGVRATGHSRYSLKGQDERYSRRKQFIFISCPRHLRTLDYGCGIGRYAIDFECYLGVDFTESLLLIARKRCPEARFQLLHNPYLDGDLDFEPELFFTSCVLQHNPDDVVLKIFESLAPIVKDNITFGLYENTETQSGHMRGRTGEEYVEMVSTYFEVREWETRSHRMSEEHAFTLMKGYCK